MSSYQVIIDGSPVDDAFYDALSSLQVEENADLPDAIRLTLPVTIANDDLTWVGDSKVRPYANIAVVVTPDGGSPQCIFDGYVLSHKVHLQAGITASTVEVWGQDASVLMGVEEKVREWSGLTDGGVANQIFSEYGFTADGANTKDDSPSHTEDAHTLMQRGSDLDFLRRLARRTGRWCRVKCEAAAGQRTGYFALPDLSGEPVVTINLNDPDKSQVQSLDFHWDVARPTKVAARQASLTDDEAGGVSADTDASGLVPLDERDLATFAGRATTVVLTAAADDPELPGRARAVLRDASWFARCEGAADLSTMKQVLRVGAVVAVEGVGTLLSGKQLVRSVRHTITTNSHAMAFTLVRNALGPSAGGGGGLLGGLV
jgi:phage protein D